MRVYGRVSRAQCSMSSVGRFYVSARTTPALLMLRCRPGTAQSSGADPILAWGGPGSAAHRFALVLAWIGHPPCMRLRCTASGTHSGLITMSALTLEPGSP
jgi:hypothetical protein